MYMLIKENLDVYMSVLGNEIVLVVWQTSRYLYCTCMYTSFSSEFFLSSEA